MELLSWKTFIRDTFAEMFFYLFIHKKFISYEENYFGCRIKRLFV
nr:MAG TPA: hypothetical protein [Caudoviricetes sp.]